MGWLEFGRLQSQVIRRVKYDIERRSSEGIARRQCLTDVYPGRAIWYGDHNGLLYKQSSHYDLGLYSYSSDVVLIDVRYVVRQSGQVFRNFSGRSRA